MAVLGWLWRRRFAEDGVRRTTPRRLVYCLPMRVLVEQTRDAVRGWLKNLELAKQVQVCVLMGGEQADDWDLHPENDAILIGTQDMLLSRALNRGYGMSRYRWPMHFGLLNSDCLWVFDEVQLMDVGAATSAQLEAFRRKFGVLQSTRSVWMSATLDEAWLNTVDFQREWLGEPLELRPDDMEIKAVNDRYKAVKPVERSEAMVDDAKACAAAIIEKHQRGSLTLAVFNTVRRAIDVADAVERQSGSKPVLIHSRFRPPDREEKLKQLLSEAPEEGRIVVSTQVVEAGVDVSAKVLFTEVAPWASLVQRFGRCNRKGEFNGAKDAQVCWFVLPEGEKDREKLAKPYDLVDLVAAEALLNQCADAGPASLAEVDAEMRLTGDHVIRKRDLLDLFDTTPDLAGNDIDVSRFIRSGDEHDVKVFWRNFAERPDETAPRREELCSVPVREFRDFHKKKREDVWRWDGLAEEWRRVEEREIYPGQTFLVRSEAGGYDPKLGWNPKSSAVESLHASNEAPEGYSRDFEDGSWLSIAEHTDDVVAELSEILADLPITEDARKTLEEAARWHDWGKAHEVFQIKIDDGQELARRVEDSQVIFRRNRPDEWRDRRDIAKAPGKRRDKDGNIRDPGFWRSVGNNDGGRRHFRHELASALAVLQQQHNAHRGLNDDDLNLVAYLIAAHHGKVRLSIRSLPNEKKPDEPGQLYARGVWDGDELPSVDLGGEVIAPSSTLSLECMQMGRSATGSPSWAERMLRLRDEWGPFRLAYLEALLRAADGRASKKEAMRGSEAHDE